MRFVLVGPSAPLRGGIAIDNDALAQALSQAGHTVAQISFSRLYPARLFPGRGQYDVTAGAVPSPAQLCIDSINPLSWWRTAHAIARSQPHLVTFQWWHPLPGQDAALRLVARQCDGVIVHSRSEHDLMTAVAPGTAVRLVDYPLLPTARALSARDAAQQRLGVSGRVLLFFGYVRKYKGVDLLLRALAQVPVDLGVTLLIAGEFYDPLESYQTLVQELNLTARVGIINRYIPEPERPDLFAATDALVLPYRAASQSMSIALAYGFGKPVIVSHVGGLAEAVEDGRTGLIAEPEPAALAVAIQRLYRELLVSPYQEHIEARRRRLGWEPFIRLLTAWKDLAVQESQAAV